MKYTVFRSSSLLQNTRDFTAKHVTFNFKMINSTGLQNEAIINFRPKNNFLLPVPIDHYSVYPYRLLMLSVTNFMKPLL